MKIVFLSIIFLSCGLIGIMIKRYHKKRKNFYLETLSFLRKMKEEITFRKTFFKEIKKEIPLPHFVKSLLEKENNDDI